MFDPRISGEGHRRLPLPGGRWILKLQMLQSFRWGPSSVPSRISVVSVEEAKAGGTPRLECPRDDQNIWLLAGVAKPASLTVGEDSLGSPCVGGTLPSSDIAGRFLPVGPAGISFTVGPVVAGGPVGSFGMMSPSDSVPAGPAGPYVAGGPVGPDGTLSPFISDPAGPAGPYDAGGPIGPYGTLSTFNSDPAGPDGLYVPYVAGGPVEPFGTLSPSDSGSVILVDPAGGALLPGEGGPKSCPSVLTEDLVLVAAVPLPAVRDPMVTPSPVEVLSQKRTLRGTMVGRIQMWSGPLP